MRNFSQSRGIPIPVLAAASFCICASVRAQTPSPVKEATVYNRSVLLIANDKLEIAIAPQGGSMLRILIQGDKEEVSPFGNPEMFPQIPDRRKLQGPMVGHFVCV